LTALLLALVLAGSCLLAPVSAHAAVLPTDTIGDRLYTDGNVPERSMPDVTMKSGLLMTDDGQILWSRNPNERRPMASITKIMTAIVSMETLSPDKEVTVPELSTEVGESSADLRTGEVMTRHQMLQALLVRSGNDAATALAIDCSGSVSAFVAKMNEQAAKLGMKNTHFMNPHGLDETNHYTTAVDIATMARYAMTFPEFREIVSSREAKFVTPTATHDYQTTNDLLLMYNGANGIKTGYTTPAGYCVVGGAKRSGVQLYAVVLGTGGTATRFLEAATLLDFGFVHYRPQSLALKGTILGRATVSDYLDRKVPVALSEDTSTCVYDLDGAVSRKVIIWTGKSPIKKGQKLGTVQFMQGKRIVATTPLVATTDVESPFILMRLWYGIVKGWRKLRS